MALDDADDASVDSAEDDGAYEDESDAGNFCLYFKPGHHKVVGCCKDAGAIAAIFLHATECRSHFNVNESHLFWFRCGQPW